MDKLPKGTRVFVSWGGTKRLGTVHKHCGAGVYGIRLVRSKKDNKFYVPRVSGEVDCYATIDALEIWEPKEQQDVPVRDWGEVKC